MHAVFFSNYQFKFKGSQTQHTIIHTPQANLQKKTQAKTSNFQLFDYQSILKQDYQTHQL